MGDIGIWQYTSSGTVDGISGMVDMDTAYNDYEAVIKGLGLNGFQKTGGNDMEKIVVYYGDFDAFATVPLSQKLHCPVMLKSDYDNSGLNAAEVIEVGGKPGTDRFDSFKEATALM